MSRGVLVTGASRGIGRAVADAFEANGDRVVRHSTGQGDLRDPEQARTVVQRAVETLGGIDVLVNNAAVYIGHPIATTSYEDWQAAWRETFAVNVFGAANVTYCSARHMIERGAGGRIINVGSRGAYRGEPDHPAYGASKAALHSFGQSLAVALGPHGIAVASVAPGFVHTERQHDAITGPEGERIRAQSPFGRVGTPEEVAAAVMYLASGPATWASGTVLDLNGASYLH
ncbi:SDR family NAD(P)-dependent oxidoreductase [Allorhizocola rhizosphaerae]|uniref:SDR family NAD(P)-dependent oxidoreductase n=1 Tax=Allorhizocola rhizosphaerae TaxID=1872709 RepID=UPI000E3BDBC9|nr:SDR family oxidoreductase [Allorhizocola rhizosphaerae]